MGDMPEPKHEPVVGEKEAGPTSVMGKMYKTLGRKFSKKSVDSSETPAAVDGDDLSTELTPEEKSAAKNKKKMANLTLKRKSKMSKEMQEQYDMGKKKVCVHYQIIDYVDLSLTGVRGY